MYNLEILKIMKEQYVKQGSYAQAEALEWAINFIEDAIQ